MHRKIIIFAFLASFAGVISAQQLSIEDAKNVAINVMFERQMSIKESLDFQAEIKDAFSGLYNQTEVWHAYNFTNGGFVIVSADISFYPVLAFSFESEINRHNNNPAFNDWIQSYSSQIYKNISENSEAKPEIFAEWQRLMQKPSQFKASKQIKTTSPLIKTKWNQGLYYNEHCPADPAGPGGRAVVGCVAVALGQIMNYFRHPETGVGEYSYIHDTYGELEVIFSEQNYNYDNMPVRPTTFNDELAKLLYHIGVSVDMNYGPNGSGMWNHKGAYTMYTYFDYKPETQYLFRDSLDPEFDWTGTLVDHLDQKIPLYYAGWSDYDYIMGHAFVLDAYSDSTHYHINWGWGGSQDGYFYIENLTPSGSDFTLLHEVIVNAIPNNEPGYCSGHKVVDSYEGIIDDGSGPFYDYQHNTNCTWLIAPQDSANGIEFEFFRFELAENDILLIFDGPSEESPILMSLASGDSPDEFVSTSDRVLIKFLSDSESNDAGWQLSFKGVKPSYCNTLTTVTEPQGEISDGSNSYMYHNNTVCMWRIQPPDAQNFTLVFEEFDTEPTNDYLHILDGNNQLIATFSGNEVPEPIFLTTDKVTLQFLTNSTIRSGGFRLYYETNIMETELINTENNFVIFPNPVDNKLNILSSYMQGDYKLYIFNSIGQKLLQEKLLINNDKSFEIDVSDLPIGVYILSFENDDEIFRDKFIIFR